MKDTVSVVIPCYNSQQYISRTINSIIHQTFVPFEIILVDDNSLDNTLQLLKEFTTYYEEIIKVFELKGNKGSSYARNFGVKKSTGNYILFMDSDDIAEHNLIEKYLSKLEKLNGNDVKYQLCYSAYIQIDKDDNVTSSVSRGSQCEPEEILGYELIRNYIPTSGVLINKNLFLETGGFNEKLRYAEDWDLWLRLAAKTGFAYVDEPLVKIRRHGENLSSKVNVMLQAEKEVLKQYDKSYIKKAIYKRTLSFEKNTVDYVSLLFRLDDWEEGFKELKSLMDQGHHFYNLFFYLGLYYLHQNQPNYALEYFTKTIKYKKNHGAALNNIGALLLIQGEHKEAKRYFQIALKYYPNYIDAKHNLKYVHTESFTRDDLKFTWRELREVLTNYQ